MTRSIATGRAFDNTEHVHDNSLAETETRRNARQHTQAWMTTEAMLTAANWKFASEISNETRVSTFSSPVQGSTWNLSWEVWQEGK